MSDYYSGLPEGTKTLFGKPVDYGGIRGLAGLQSNTGHNLSGGQMQRLAVCVCRFLRLLSATNPEVCRARTFMRSIVSADSTVGLLLFDEPSASLDPTAEHGLSIPVSASRKA